MPPWPKERSPMDPPPECFQGKPLWSRSTSGIACCARAWPPRAPTWRYVRDGRDRRDMQELERRERLPLAYSGSDADSARRDRSHDAEVRRVWRGRQLVNNSDQISRQRLFPVANVSDHALQLSPPSHHRLALPAEGQGWGRVAHGLGQPRRMPNKRPISPPSMAWQSHQDRGSRDGDRRQHRQRSAPLCLDAFGRKPETRTRGRRGPDSTLMTTSCSPPAAQVSSVDQVAAMALFLWRDEARRHRRPLSMAGWWTAAWGAVRPMVSLGDCLRGADLSRRSSRWPPASFLRNLGRSIFGEDGADIPSPGDIAVAGLAEILPALSVPLPDRATAGALFRAPAFLYQMWPGSGIARGELSLSSRQRGAAPLLPPSLRFCCLARNCALAWIPVAATAAFSLCAAPTGVRIRHHPDRAALGLGDSDRGRSRALQCTDARGSVSRQSRTFITWLFLSSTDRRHRLV